VPVWARREAERERQKQDGSDLPFGVYLLASAIVAIAAVGRPSLTGKQRLMCSTRAPGCR